jgi:DHA2 family multidrug resistance protein
MRDLTKRFDWMAFSFLGIGIGALQLLLDRGTSQDWFSSKEIWIETIVAGVGLYLFIVHLWTSDSEFVPHALLKDQNYMAGFLVIFFIAQLMLAGSVALAPYLENLGGYSVVRTGLLMSPRGLGTIVAILIVPFLVRKIDTRLVVGVGIVLTALSMRVMSSWTPQVSQTTIVFWMMVQGCSVGFLFGPVNLISFATLAPKFRTSGAAFVALARNLGGGIGISISTSLLARNAQVAHASMAAHVSPFNRALDVGAQSMFYNLHQPLGLSSLNQLISGQAQIIAYADGFLYLSTLSLFCLGALLLMRKVTLDFAAQKELDELMNE